MLMRTYVFIDGENLRGAIKGVFPQFRGKYLPPADWGKFFRRIVEKAQIPGEIDAVLLKSYWYVVADVDTHPRLPHRDNPEKMIEWKNANQSRIDSCLHEINQSKSDDKKVSVSTPESLKSFVKQLDDKKGKIEREFRGYRVVQSAIEHQCRSLQFRRSGYIGFDLLEKKGRLGREKNDRCQSCARYASAKRRLRYGDYRLGRSGFFARSAGGASGGQNCFECRVSSGGALIARRRETPQRGGRLEH